MRRCFICFFTVCLLFAAGARLSATAFPASGPTPVLASGVGLTVVPGPEGHLSIGLETTPASAETPVFIPFSRFKAWRIEPDLPLASPPATVVELDGRDVEMAGFMFPLQEGEAVRAFLLTATTQTCCYGPRPEYNQFLLVEIPEPVPFLRLNPCRVRGRFVIEPRPADGYVFRMEATRCDALPVLERTIVSSGTTPEATLLTWHEIETLRPTGSEMGLAGATLPATIAALLDQNVILSGNLVNGAQITATETWITIVSHPWDGCCYGRPPEFADAVALRLASGSVVPQPWHKQGRFTGRLRAFPADEREPRGRILWLDEARSEYLSDSFIGGRMASFPASPLVKAAAEGDIPGVRLLLRAGVSIGARDAGGNTAIHLAATVGSIPMLDELLSRGATCTVRNPQHETPLHHAAGNGHESTVSRLLSAGAEIDPADKFGFTPLARAIANGYPKTALLLLDHGARLDATTSLGLTPMGLAVRYRQPEVVKRLATGKAELSPVDRQGQTPLAYARAAGDREMVDLLVQLGATR